jgi:hypothetical protein
LFESPGNGLGQGVRPIAPEFGVDLFKSTNQVENVFTFNRTACGLAKVGPTTEGPRIVDDALLGVGLQKGAGVVGRLG